MSLAFLYGVVVFSPHMAGRFRLAAVSGYLYTPQAVQVLAKAWLFPEGSSTIPCYSFSIGGPMGLGYKMLHVHSEFRVCWSLGTGLEEDIDLDGTGISGFEDILKGLNQICDAHTPEWGMARHSGN